MPDLPVLLAALVAIVLLAVFVGPRLAGRRARPGAGPPLQRVLSDDDDRASLGIVGGVRVRGAAPSDAAVYDEDDDLPPFDGPPDDALEDAAPAEADVPAPAPVVPRRAASVEESQRPPQRARRSLRDEELSAEEATRAAQEHLLNALLLAAGAHTVALLRHEPRGSGHRYTVERIVSRSGYARGAGTFSTRDPLVPADAPRRARVARVGHGSAVSSEALGYYREPLAALREVLTAPVRLGEADALLVADAMHEGRLDTRRVKTLAEATARLLEHVPPTAGTATPRPDPDTASGDGLPAPSDTPAVPSRRAVIADELARAGTHGLALALVHVEPSDDAPDAEADGAPGALADAETDLADALRAILPEDARLERFGDLTFGVFLRDLDGVDAWVDAADQLLAAAYPDTRTALGVVLHDGLAALTADDLRGYAHTALAASFDEGEPVILG